MTRSEWAAEKLGIKVSASIEDARVAKRDLMQVWHPDQYHGNERLRARAEAECKLINLAFNIFAGKDDETPIEGLAEEPPRTEQATSSPEPAPRQTSEYTHPPYSHSSTHQGSSTASSGGGGAFGGLVIGLFIGAFFGGWGAIPGAIIGAMLGSALGGADRSAGDSLDSTGGCLLEGLGQVIGAIFSSVAGCGCVLVLLLIIAVIISAASG